MGTSRVIVGVAALGATLAVGLTALALVLATDPSQAQSGAMHNCPPAGKWSMAVWDGASGATPNDALATCGAGAVTAAYSLEPQTGGWSRWFAGRPEVSDLAIVSNLQGILALGAAQPPSTPTPQPTTTPTPPPSVPTVEPTQVCCKYCTTGKACGNTCISKSYTCHQPPGCACNAY